MDNRMKYCEVQVAKEPTGKLPGALFFNMPGKTKKIWKCPGWCGSVGWSVVL